MKSVIKELLKTTITNIWKLLNGLGSKKKCYICGSEFFFFTRYGKGSKGIPDFNHRLDIVGSDVDNFGCMYCGSFDRERHLFMFSISLAYGIT